MRDGEAADHWRDPAGFGPADQDSARAPEPDATPAAEGGGETAEGSGETAEGSGETAEGSGGKRKKSWRQLMMIVLTAIVLMLLIKAFVVQVYRIPSASMEDTLLTGDRVLVNKLVYHLRGIDRGDIVVFSGEGSWGSTTGAPDPAPPGNPVLRALDDVLADIGVYSRQTYYIKRVIGLPGDHVMCCQDGRVTVNGVPLDETSYVFPGASPSNQPFSVIVPRGRLWVMGDNRAISDDSRGHKLSGFPGQGTVPESEVAGRAFLIIWPPSQFGDLPIPPAFRAVAAAPAAPAAPAAGLAAAGLAAAGLGVPLVARQVRRVVARPVRRARRRGPSRGRPRR